MGSEIEARLEFERESALSKAKADRFDLGEVFLKIALVISSLALLSRNVSIGSWNYFGARRPRCAATGFFATEMPAAGFVLIVCSVQRASARITMSA